MNIDVIKKRIKIIKDLQEEARSIKANLDENLNENQLVQESQQRKSEFKQEMVELDERIKAYKDSPVIKDITEDLKEKKQEIKENKEILSQELADYYRENGTLEISDEEGTLYFIKFAAKLLGK